MFLAACVRKGCSLGSVDEDKVSQASIYLASVFGSAAIVGLEGPHLYLPTYDLFDVEIPLDLVASFL